MPALAAAIARAVGALQPRPRCSSGWRRRSRWRPRPPTPACGSCPRPSPIARYMPDGALQPRSEPGSVITDAAPPPQQAVEIAVEHRSVAADGKDGHHPRREHLLPRRHSGRGGHRGRRPARRWRPRRDRRAAGPGVIRPFGEAALLVETPATPSRAQALAAALLADPIPGVTAAVPGLQSAARRARAADRPIVDPCAVRSSAGWPRSRCRATSDARPHDPGRLRRRDGARPGGRGGPGRPLRRPTSSSATPRPSCASCSDGFAPGFAYLGELPDAICRVPRLDTPRTRTPAGSVADRGADERYLSGDPPGRMARHRAHAGHPVRSRGAIRPPTSCPATACGSSRSTPAMWEGRAGVPDDW